MSWPREAVSVLLDCWEQHPCLYDNRHQWYFNKSARLTALDKIAKAVSECKPNTTASDCKVKMNSMRSQFVAEFNKHVKSIRNGKTSEEVYYPGLWFYNKLRFLIVHVKPRKLCSSGNADTSAPISAPSSPSAEDYAVSEVISISESEWNSLDSSNAELSRIGMELMEESNEEPGSSTPDTAHKRNVLIDKLSPKRRKASSTVLSNNDFSTSSKCDQLMNNSKIVKQEDCSGSLEGYVLGSFLASGWDNIKSPKIKMRLKHQWLQALMDAEIKDNNLASGNN